MQTIALDLNDVVDEQIGQKRSIRKSEYIQQQQQ